MQMPSCWRSTCRGRPARTPQRSRRRRTQSPHQQSPPGLPEGLRQGRRQGVRLCRKARKGARRPARRSRASQQQVQGHGQNRNRDPGRGRRCVSAGSAARTGRACSRFRDRSRRTRPGTRAGFPRCTSPPARRLALRLRTRSRRPAAPDGRAGAAAPGRLPGPAGVRRRLFACAGIVRRLPASLLRLFKIPGPGCAVH